MCAGKLSDGVDVISLCKDKQECCDWCRAGTDLDKMCSATAQLCFSVNAVSQMQFLNLQT